MSTYSKLSQHLQQLVETNIFKNNKKAVFFQQLIVLNFIQKKLFKFYTDYTINTIEIIR